MCGPDWRTNCGVGGGGRRAWKNIFIYFSSFQIFWGLAICNVIVKTLSNLQAVSQKVAALGRSIGVSPTNVRKGIVGGPEMITSGMSHHREAKLSRTIKGSEYISDHDYLVNWLPLTPKIEPGSWVLRLIDDQMSSFSQWHSWIILRGLFAKKNCGGPLIILNLFPENLSASPFLELNNSCKRLG